MRQENKISYQDDKILKFIIESPKYGIKEVTIDKEDWNKTKQYRWWVSLDKSINNFYVTTQIYINKKKREIRLHRLILNINDPKIQGDHIFHDTLDNRKELLRSCSQSENMLNSGIQKNNTSGFKGVVWSKQARKWVCRINVNKKRIHLGYFDNSKDAALIYNINAIKYHGEFACLNNIEANNGGVSCL